MNKPADHAFAGPALRHSKNPWRTFKQNVKNLLFPVPGVRKFIVSSRQRLDHFLYDLRKPAAEALFQSETRPGRPRAIVISIPKSGTYLLHGLLKELGLIASGVHLGESGYYDQRQEKEARTDFGEVKIDSPLKAAIKRVGDGQIAAGHLLYLSENKKALRDFRIFFTYRETRAVFVSFMRYFSKPGHGDEFGTAWKAESDDKKRMEKFMRLYAPSTVVLHADIAGWMKHENALPVKFETLCGDEGEAAQRALIRKIAAHVGVDLDDAQAGELAGKVIGGGSRTWSGKRSIVEHYWSDASERIFRKTGGTRLNRHLGYT